MGVEPRLATTSALTIIFAGEIADYLQTRLPHQQVISIDCEWTIGHKKADLLQIGLSDGRVYLFHLAKTQLMPLALKLLLQSDTVKKVGNRIHNDVAKLKDWGVNVINTIELGHLAHARTLVQTRAPRLSTLVSVLFKGATIEGKDSFGLWATYKSMESMLE